jgi:hypothetical protein
VSELPSSPLGANTGVRARLDDATAPATRSLPTTEQTSRAIPLSSEANHRAIASGPLRATGRIDHGERLLIDRADAKADIHAGGTDRCGTRRPTGALRAARRLGIVGC